MEKAYGSDFRQALIRRIGIAPEDEALVGNVWVVMNAATGETSIRFEVQGRIQEVTCLVNKGNGVYVG